MALVIYYFLTRGFSIKAEKQGFIMTVFFFPRNSCSVEFVAC